VLAMLPAVLAMLSIYIGENINEHIIEHGIQVPIYYNFYFFERCLYKKSDKSMRYFTILHVDKC